MELAQYNIHVETVLPGPVASQVTDKAFTEDINIEYKDSPGFIKVDFPVMPTERCAKLMVIGMANNLDEVWISENPMLLATYMKQYFPNLYSWIVKAIMDRMMAKFTEERQERRAQEK